MTLRREGYTRTLRCPRRPEFSIRHDGGFIPFKKAKNRRSTALGPIALAKATEVIALPGSRPLASCRALALSEVFTDRSRRFSQTAKSDDA